MNGILRNLKTIDQYWFGTGSPTALGFLRIVIGFLASIDIIVCGLRWEDWYSEKGFVPISLAQMWFPGDPYVWYWGKEAPIWEGGRILPKINLLSGVTNPLWAQVIFWGVLVCAILTMFGLWTRVSTFLLAVGIISIQHRNPMILMGGDSVLRISCIYLALSPCGTVCSVDRLLAIWQGRIQPGPVIVSLWTQRLISFNVALVYVTTVWIKWYGVHWKLGDAEYYAGSLPEFFRFPYPHFLNEMPWNKLVTWGSLLMEFFLGTLVFYRPLRKYVLLGGLLLHGGIEYAMNVPLFGYLLTACYITFFDGEEVAGWFERVGQRLQRFRITVHLPQGASLQPRAQAILRAIDIFGLVSYTSGDRDSFYVTKADGSASSGMFIVFTRSVGAWPFLGMPWIWSGFLSRALEG